MMPIDQALLELAVLTAVVWFPYADTYNYICELLDKD
jgi:hypothetical protein